MYYHEKMARIYKIKSTVQNIKYIYVYISTHICGGEAGVKFIYLEIYTFVQS